MKLSRRKKANPEFSLAAMTDVILLLLIFFMITSSTDIQSAINVNLPKGKVKAIDIPNHLSISIKTDGSFFIDEEQVQKHDLEKLILKKLKNVTNPSFTIKADKDCLHKDVVFVMQIAEKHKYNLAIATTTEME